MEKSKQRQSMEDNIIEWTHGCFHQALCNAVKNRAMEEVGRQITRGGPMVV